MANRSLGNVDVHAVRQIALRWTAAIERGDIDALKHLMADDIIVVHGNGRTLSGRDAVIADLARSMENFHIRQSLEFEETIVVGDWAFDRTRVHTTITPRDGGMGKEFYSKTLTLLRRAVSGEWAVARVIGVVEKQE